jgi:Zn-finger protein
MECSPGVVVTLSHCEFIFCELHRTYFASFEAQQQTRPDKLLSCFNCCWFQLALRARAILLDGEVLVVEEEEDMDLCLALQVNK